MNYNAGCKSAVSNVVMALTVMVTLLLLMPLFYYTPGVVLASIIVAAVLGLIDFPAAYFIWKVDKVDFICSPTNRIECNTKCNIMPDPY